MIHGHEVLHMMMEQSYTSKDQLLKDIKTKFGDEERFYTCSASNMTAEELVDFLEKRGKFMPCNEKDFTVNAERICNNHTK